MKIINVIMINLIPTYEQYLENYVADEKIITSYQVENEAWDAEKSIGCGNAISTKKVVSGTVGGLGGAALFVTAIICPPVAVGAVLTTGVVGGLAKVGSDLVDQDSILHDILEVTSESCGTATMIGSGGGLANRGGACRGHSH
jgi:hypothetical protein